MSNENNPPVVARQSYVPTNKAVAATGGSAIGAAIATLIVYWIDPTNTLPGTISGAITTLVTATVTLVAAWVTPPGANEAVVNTADGPRSARI
jgi:hypothetical protein